MKKRISQIVIDWLERAFFWIVVIFIDLFPFIIILLVLILGIVGLISYFK